MGCDVSKFARKVGQASQPLNPSNSTLVNPLNVQHDESEEGKDKDNNLPSISWRKCPLKLAIPFLGGLLVGWKTNMTIA
jgi:hypothetical protein